MPKTRDKSYWRDYRKIKSNVGRHINSVYNAEIIVDLSSTDTTASISSAHCNLENNETLLDGSNYDDQNNHAQSARFEAQLDYESPDPYDSSDTSDENVSDTEQIDLNSQISNWASRFNIPHAALRGLLEILCPFHESLPKDPRTLLQTQKNVEVTEVSGGHYYHFGIENSVRNQIACIPLDLITQQQETLLVQINIDGVPLFKTSNTQFWPILGRIIYPFTAEPFAIGIFLGNKKPSDVNSFLKDFVDEMKLLEQKTICITEVNCDFSISISCVICDAPARAFVKQVKGHSGYFGCDKCVQKGVWDGKMTFPDVNAEVRTDVQFDEMSNSGHHHGRSPFMDLSIGMVSQFPLDFMHLVCLGVMKRLLWIWMKGPRQCYRLGSSSIHRISECLLQLRKHLPREFLRKGRTLYEIDRWKAAELRQFLLYTGPLSLQGTLSLEVYRHFMLLSVAIYCLSSRFYYQEYASYSNELLRTFVTDFAKLYGQDMLVYNVHGLIHLASDVAKFGPLDNFSAFVFESFLARLKKLIRKPNYPLQQVVKRLSENCNVTEGHNVPPSGKVKKEHRNGPLPENANNFLQFNELHLPVVFLSVFEGDNCVLIGNRVAIVRNIICENVEDDKRIVYEEFLHADNFFDYPLESKDLMIFVVSELSGETKVCNVSDIACKCVLLPINDSFLSVPLLHTT